MKKFLLALAVFSIFAIGFSFAQTITYQYQKIVDRDFGFTYSIPKSWRTDPYSTSAVCNCAGVIADNYDNEVKINLYPTDAEGMKAQMRNEIWDYRWDDQSAKRYVYQSASKTKFDAQIGQWFDAEDGHTVIRLDAKKGDRYVRIFIFGPSADMDAQAAVIQKFIDTFAFLKKNGRYVPDEEEEEATEW